MGESDIVLNNIIKFSFAVIGAITGYTLTRTFFVMQDIQMASDLKMVIFILDSVVVAVFFFFTGNKIIETILEGLDTFEGFIQKMTIPINKVEIIGVPIAIVVNILFGCIGIVIAVGKRNDDLFESLKDKKGNTKGRALPEPKVLDTSVIIDGRIVDICRTGFLEGELIVPSFVLEELRHIADSSDALKRNKGRRGLDVLNMLQKELKYPVRIEDFEVRDDMEVDDKLLKMAQKINGKVMTIDYNLNKVASFQGVAVLNINELANALKPIALPGEEMVVQVIKDGKESGQGVGYLDDGTMIVVDGGRRHVGESVSVMVTSVLQTAAGRMIFAKPKYATIERVI
jgi:uncharacterized protein YacL